MKPGTEYVIKITQQELNKQFKDAIQKTGCDIKQGKNGKIIIIKKQEEEEFDIGEMVAFVDQKNKELDEKDTEKLKKDTEEAKQAKKEAEQEKIYLALASYGNEIATNLNNLLDFNQSKKEVLEILDRTFLDAKNLKQGHFYETTQDEINLRVGTLKQIKSHYKSDNKIIKKINDIIKIFNKYNENHQLIG